MKWEEIKEMIIYFSASTRVIITFNLINISSLVAMKSWMQFLIQYRNAVLKWAVLKYYTHDEASA